MIRLLLLALTLFVSSANTLASAEVIEVIPLHNRTAEDVGALIGPLLAPQDRVIANGNNLIIKATPARLKTLQQLINQLDTPIQNLIITVVQDRYTTAVALNAEARIQLYGQHSNHSTSIAGNVKGRFYQNQGHANINNSQTLRTVDGQPAHIEVGKAHPIRRTSFYQPLYGYPEIHNSTEFIEATTGFAVTPRLAGNNQVIIDVAPWSDRFNHYGEINTQGAQTTLRVNLGEWIEIGGVSETSHSQHSGILSQSQSNQSDNLHIVIKVDKAP